MSSFPSLSFCVTRAVSLISFSVAQYFTFSFAMSRKTVWYGGFLYLFYAYAVPSPQMLWENEAVII